jgi:hypothetical protein
LSQGLNLELFHGTHMPPDPESLYESPL